MSRECYVYKTERIDLQGWWTCNTKLRVRTHAIPKQVASFRYLYPLIILEVSLSYI